MQLRCLEGLYFYEQSLLCLDPLPGSLPKFLSSHHCPKPDNRDCIVRRCLIEIVEYDFRDVEKTTHRHPPEVQQVIHIDNWVVSL